MLIKMTCFRDLTVDRLNYGKRWAQIIRFLGFDECFTMVEEFPHEKVVVKLTKQKISDVLYNYFNSGVYCWDCRNANDDTDDSCCFCHRKSMFWQLSRGAANSLADEILGLGE